MSWLAETADEITALRAVVRVTVVRADGSTPREVGAAMLVGAALVRDTVGGGALELAAIAHARALLGGGVRPLAKTVESHEKGVREGSDPEREGADHVWARDVRDFQLGPSLGQCCGGYVRLLFEVFTGAEHDRLLVLAERCDRGGALLLRPLDSGLPIQVAADRKAHRADWPLAVTRAVREMLSGARPREATLVRGAKGDPAWFVEPCAPRRHRLYLYGAGHVGRAVVRVLQDLPFAITWIDTSPARFPESILPHAKPEIAQDPSAFALTTESSAFHLVLTYSHALDLAICHALLNRGDFRFLGLIGSAAKRARFLKRLAGFGIGEAQLGRLVCPIGLPGIDGKEPAIIALSVAAQLVQVAATAEARAAAPSAKRGDTAP